MSVERVVGGSSLVEVLDRVLDKGIVVDAWIRVSLVGIELVTIEARVVIASVDTYLRYAQAIVGTPQVSRPRGVEAPGRYEELSAEIAALRAQLAAPPLRAEPQLQPAGRARTRKTIVLEDERPAAPAPRARVRKARELEPAAA
ncbi:hypothetical protein GCM10028796_56880 [Ramlibacter monticola]|uniref:Gas vesicle protein A n=1 Tax=Ramlibacter monticola TaxID=1926872 RepID=A0A936Z437_9BURK|nr:gas vesicle structural protein GvpA [Ramlibacter monticola]MBL0393262.1 gas vesicle structural protein GvpA [Ramlibacter monticola]